MGNPDDAPGDRVMFTTRVSTPEELTRQAEAVARVRVARINRGKATDELKREIVAAVDAGAAIKDIAKAADFTRQRIFQIVKEYRER